MELQSVSRRRDKTTTKSRFLEDRLNLVVAQLLVTEWGEEFSIVLSRTLLASRVLHLQIEEGLKVRSDSAIQGSQ